MNPLQHHADIIGIVIRAAVPAIDDFEINEFAMRASGVCRAWRAVVRRLIGPRYAEWLAAREAIWLRRQLRAYNIVLNNAELVSREYGISPYAVTKRPLSDARRFRKHRRLGDIRDWVFDFRFDADLMFFEGTADQYHDCLANVAKSLASQAW